MPEERLLLVNLRRQVEPDEVAAELARLRIIEDTTHVGDSWAAVLRSSCVNLEDDLRSRLQRAGLELLRSHGDLVRSLRDNPPHR
jgi:hypothetical protein